MGLLIRLWQLDPHGPRCAYFFQDDVKKALQIAVFSNSEVKAMLEGKGTSSRTSVELLLQKMAYHIRVMCSHTRAKLGSYKAKQLVDFEFLQLWEIKSAGIKAATQKKAPFVNFQPDSSDDAETQDIYVEALAVVAA